MKCQINYHDLMQKVESCCINLGYLQDIPKTSQHHRQEQRHQHHAENPAITDLIPLRDSQFPYSTICGQRWFQQHPRLSTQWYTACDPLKSRISYLQLSPSLRKICEPCGNPTRHLMKISQHFQNIAKQTKPKSMHRLKKEKKRKKNAPSNTVDGQNPANHQGWWLSPLFIGF